MSKLKPLTKEVNLKEFKRRACTCCNGKVLVDSVNGRTGGRYGNACGKIVICQKCNIDYFYDWNSAKEKYIIDRVFLNFPGSDVDAFIDYSGKLRKDYGIENHSEDKTYNTFIRIQNSTATNYVYFFKTYSLPKKRIVKTIRDKVEIYAVFI